jgi:nucleotide-binding universal stress UspA family protein
MEKSPSTIFKHILVPTDFGESAGRAAAIAADLASKYGASLTLVHSYEVPISGYPGVIIPLTLSDSIRESAQAELNKQLAEVRSRGAKADGLLTFDAPAQAIAQAIESTRADLVVMGTHGRKGINRLLMGSIAEKVVRMSAVPVLTVR